MTRRRKLILGAIAAVGVVLGAAITWYMIPPRAMAFAGGHPVELSEYRGPPPSACLRSFATRALSCAGST